MQSKLSFVIVTNERPLIAIVDDDEPIRKALTRLLRSFGYDIESFPSGAEFLESLSTHQPGCVVLDLHMPGISGFEVQVRLEQSRINVPVIVITGHDSLETRAQVMNRKPVAYLRKPVNDQVLHDAIELALGQNPGVTEKQ